MIPVYFSDRKHVDGMRQSKIKKIFKHISHDVRGICQSLTKCYLFVAPITDVLS